MSPQKLITFNCCTSYNNILNEIFFCQITSNNVLYNNVEQCLSSIVRKYIFSPSESNLTAALKSLVHGKLIDHDDNMSLRS